MPIKIANQRPKQPKNRVKNNTTNKNRYRNYPNHAAIYKKNSNIQTIYPYILNEYAKNYDEHDRDYAAADNHSKNDHAPSENPHKKK